MNAGFGKLIDYFGFQEATHGALRLISSDGGHRRERPKAWNGNTLGGFEDGGTIIAPVCSYVVTKDLTLTAKLGNAWAATESAGKMTSSGYFLTSVYVATAVGAFPVVTLTAEANEGADAINTWDISIPIKARAKAQNLLNVYTGANKLNAFKLTAAADAVVLWEDNMPSASDIVHGMMVADISTLSTSGSSAESVANGWTVVEFPPQGVHDYYLSQNIKAERVL